MDAPLRLLRQRCKLLRHNEQGARRPLSIASLRHHLRTVDVLGPIGGPVLLQVFSVLVISGAHAHQDAAFLDAFLGLLAALFGDAPADQGAYDAAGSSTSSGASDGGRERTGHDQSE